jgi:hypothetical protein
MNLSDDRVMNASWDIITNPEIIAVNQQFVGHPGMLVDQYYPVPGEDGPSNSTYAWALPCDGSAQQAGWVADTHNHTLIHGSSGHCLTLTSGDSIELSHCNGSSAQHFSIDNETGALIHGIFSPPPPPPPPLPPGKQHSTCSALRNSTNIVGGKVVNTHPNKDRCGVTLQQCCALCDDDPKCIAFTLDPDANWGGTCVGKTFCWTFSDYTGTRSGGYTFGSKGVPPPGPPKPAPGASCVVQQDVYGTVSNHLSIKAIKTMDDLQSCDRFDMSTNGTLVGRKAGVFMDDTPTVHNGVSGMPPRRLPCLAAQTAIPPLLAGPIQVWAKPQPSGAVAVFVVHMGQMESSIPHTNQTVTISFARIPWMKAAQKYKVRDLHSRQDLGGEHLDHWTLDSPLMPVASRMLMFSPL